MIGKSSNEYEAITTVGGSRSMLKFRFERRLTHYVRTIA